MIMTICRICGKDVDIRTHIKVHKLTSKEYYDRYIKKENEGICPICEKETKFLGILKGYRQYCSNKCHQNDPVAQEERITKSRLKNFGIEKRKETWKLKSIEELKEIDSKKRKTIFEKFGKEYYSQTNEWKENIPSKISKSQKILIENNLHHTQKIGYVNPFSLDYVKDKIKETKLKKYNNETYNNHDKFKHTCLEKYGVENPMKNHDIFKKTKKKYTFNDIEFDSAPELAYYIWLTDNNIDFEYQPNISFEYEYDGKIHNYYPDFKVNEEYIELKGSHFFKNDKMINPYDRTQDGLYEAKHQCMLKNNIKIITDYNQYEDYVNKKYTKDFLDLFRNDLEFPYLNTELKDKSDIGLIHHFHKSIYEANKFSKPSPIKAWNNKKLIYKCALNRLKYIGKCKPNDILQGFSVTQIAPKISLFKPRLAERLIKEYLNDYDTIFDPFSGFSGRMIGAMNCHKKYIGQDINELHIKESNDIISYKKYNNCIVNVQDILTDNNKEYDCLFTCPPYGGKEHWNKDNDEIEKSCDEWINICLNKYNCKKYLFVVDKTEKYKNNIIETLENKSHFGKNNEYVILIKKE